MCEYTTESGYSNANLSNVRMELMHVMAETHSDKEPVYLSPAKRT